MQSSKCFAHHLSNVPSVGTNYTSSPLTQLFVALFPLKYQFHGPRASERATPLGAEVSAGAKPQVSYFLQPPTHDSHTSSQIDADPCVNTSTHTTRPCSNRWFMWYMAFFVGR